MKKMDKRIPVFKSEDEERAFWATHTPLDYFDSHSIQRSSFPNLKPSLKSISIRVPSDMLAELKNLANKKDVPYQSLAKVYLPKRCIKSVVRIPPHPALSPGIGGEGKGEGEIRDEDGIHRR